jgi:hypothetical protein
MLANLLFDLFSFFFKVFRAVVVFFYVAAFLIFFFGFAHFTRHWLE